MYFIAAGFCIALLSGCTYITTLNPSANERLFALKQERLARADKKTEKISLEELQERIQALRSPSLVFRTRLQDDQIIIEAFTGIAELKAVLTAVFNDQPSFWETVSLIGGQRTEQDRLPAELLSADRISEGLALEKQTEHGAAYSRTLSGQEKDQRNAQAIAAQIRQLVLLLESGPLEPQGDQYRVLLAQAGESGADTLIFDGAQRLHVRTKDGSSSTYALMNSSQWTLLKTGLDALLVSAREDGPAVSGNDGDPSGGLELPTGDQWAVIGQAKDSLPAPGGPDERILVEHAMVGRIDLSQGEYVSQPQRLSGIWHQTLDKTKDGSEVIVTSIPLDPGAAGRLAERWGIPEKDLDALSGRLQAEALFQFLQHVMMRNAVLDPAVIWR